MQTLTRMDKGIIEDYDHVTTMNECELDETDTYYHFWLKTSRPPFGHVPLLQSDQ